MKNVFNLMWIALCILMTGCSSDDEVTTHTLKVIKSEASFSALGGTGMIEVEAVGDVSAVSSADWCTVSVSGHTVMITAIENFTIEGRAAMITITSGEESTKVPVNQLGEAFATDLTNYIFPVKGGSKTFSLKFTHKCQIEGAPEWLTYVFGEESITFTVGESKANRVGSFTLKSGKKELKFSMGQVITVSGSYDVLYKDDEGTMAKGAADVLEDTEGNCEVTISGIVINCMLSATYKNLEFAFAFPQYLGRISPYEVYLCAYSPGTLSWDSSFRYNAIATYDDNGKLMFAFSDRNKTWADKEMTGFFFGAFDKKMEAGGAYKGGYGTAESIIMIQK